MVPAVGWTMAVRSCKCPALPLAVVPALGGLLPLLVVPFLSVASLLILCAAGIVSWMVHDLLLGDADGQGACILSWCRWHRSTTDAKPLMCHDQVDDEHDVE